MRVAESSQPRGLLYVMFEEILAVEIRSGLFEESDLLGNDSDMFFLLVGACTCR